MSKVKGQKQDWQTGLHLTNSACRSRTTNEKEEIFGGDSHGQLRPHHLRLCIGGAKKRVFSSFLQIFRN